ncbi:DUF1428 domain-containing protein [Altererythrobacter sp. TH136]|nr:DUF1428 domain-containing protein [Altererythrobacter sp. TH136]
MSYFDGFVIPVAASDRDRFVQHARTIDPIFLENGALRVVECWGADLKPGKTTDFQGAVAARDGETVAFAWVEWPDKDARDTGMAAVSALMGKDPRMDPATNPMPFDGQRMIFGGFAPIVSHGAFAQGQYVQGFIVPVPEDRREDYRQMADDAWDMFQGYGATAVVEAWGDDVPHGAQTDFYRAVKAEPGEAIVFSYMAWPSREVCDAAAEKMMHDPEMKMPDDVPFSPQRMVFGGFDPVLVLEQPR